MYDLNASEFPSFLNSELKNNEEFKIVGYENPSTLYQYPRKPKIKNFLTGVYDNQ